jgi:hypothetical protein
LALVWLLLLFTGDEMMAIYYIYRFKRRNGMPRIHALKQAIQAALRP